MRIQKIIDHIRWRTARMSDGGCINCGQLMGHAPDCETTEIIETLKRLQDRERENGQDQGAQSPGD